MKGGSDKDAGSNAMDVRYETDELSDLPSMFNAGFVKVLTWKSIIIEISV